MKRSPLHRRTPLNRKTPLRPMGQAKRKERAETDPVRRAYVRAAGGRCENCGRRASLDLHEIPAGAHRHVAVYSPNCWLALCRECHDELQGLPFRVQLVVKCRAASESINRAVGRNVLTLVGVQCAEDANERKGL